MAKPSIWTTTQDDHLVALWSQGLSAEAIGAELGMSDRQIISRASVLRDRCPPRQDAGELRRWDDADDRRLRHLYEQGANRDTIVAALDRTWPSCSNRAFFLKLRRPNHREARDARLLELVRSGALVPDAAATVGVTPTCAYQVLRRLRRQGVEVPDLQSRERRDEAVERAQAVLTRLRARRPLDTGAIDRQRLPWLGGVLDARATIQVCVHGHPQVVLTSSRRALIAECWLVTGMGCIYREVRRKGLVIWRWSTTSTDDCARLLREVAPHMHVRRQLALLVASWPIGGQYRGVAGLPDKIHQERKRIMEEIAYVRAVEDLPKTSSNI